MRGAFAGILLAAAAIGHAPLTLSRMPAVQPATPAPLAPPTSPGPGPSPPPTRLSPMLLGPGAGSAVGTTPPGPPSSIDQQKLQSYRNTLESQQRALDRAGVSPANPRYREIQQELQRLNSAPPP